MDVGTDSALQEPIGIYYYEFKTIKNISIKVEIHIVCDCMRVSMPEGDTPSLYMQCILEGYHISRFK